jgi:hypothetical protein
MRTDEEIQEELSNMTMQQKIQRISDLLTKVGAINSDTGKAPTVEEVEVMLIGSPQ